MQYSLVIIGLVFMALSVFQLNKPTKMDDAIIRNYERRYTITDRERLLQVEYTSKAIFGAIVALIGILQILFLDVNTGSLLTIACILLWQIGDSMLKRPFLIKK